MLHPPAHMRFAPTRRLRGQERPAWGRTAQEGAGLAAGMAAEGCSPPTASSTDSITICSPVYRN